MGDAGLGCTGNEHVATPHLDRLAAEGARFSDFHSSGTVCSPTRAGLLTGRYQQRTGVVGVINADPKHPSHGHALPHDELTFAELLRARGYRTACFGKWHLGYEAADNPVHHGFDEFVGFVSGNVDYHSHYDRMGTADWWRRDELQPEAGYTTELVTQHALDFLDSHVARHGDRPFCLYLPHAAIHDPNQGPTDPPIRGPDRRPRSELAPTREAVAAMTRSLDAGVGRLLARLAALGIDDRTLVVFLSDNGGTRANRTTGEGVRGFKASVFEGGHLVPAIFRWPGRIATGQVLDIPAISLDLLPTMLGLAGVAAPRGRVLDGVDLAPLLVGEADELRERDLYWQFKGNAAIRRGPWKLVATPRGRSLFHLGRDPGERRNLAAAEPAKVEELSDALERWRAEVARPSRPK